LSYAGDIRVGLSLAIALDEFRRDGTGLCSCCRHPAGEDLRRAASDGAERWAKRCDLFVRTIREQQPDVFGTQELYKQQGDYVASKLPE